MPLCFVPSCKNRSDNRHWKKCSGRNEISKITFHRFPKSDNIRKLWADILDINSSPIPTGARICSAHFAEESFDRSSPLSIRLRPNALPHRVHESTCASSSAAIPVEECAMDQVPQVAEQVLRAAIPVAEQVPRATSPVAQKKILVDRATSPIMVISAPQPSTSKEDKGTIITPDLVYNSPEKTRLRQRIDVVKAEYSKKIRALQQNLRRSTDRIATLQSTLDALKEKNLINDEQANVLHTLGGSNGEIFNRLLKKKSKKSVSKEYDPQVRSFALTLHYYSPRAYEYVRSKFDCCLPHAKTISKWYGSIDGNPGICSEALKSIKHRVDNTDYQLVGALMFDEMAIRQHLEYDGSKFSGYTDMGEHIVEDDNTLAREALVFMAVCLNSAWKIPIAYYLIHGITAEQKRNLTLQCISALHDVGFKVISVTCDGTSTNISALKRLGCNYDNVTSLQTSFPHPVTGEKIMTFPDPCHMLKLVRNALGDIQSMIDSENRPVLWSHLTRLHNLQENEQMHLGNKMRSAHIHYSKQKMKVRLATQIFSKSVADSLLFCRNTLHLEDFKFCMGTVQFLLIFNDLFDILNSKNIKQPGFKKALNERNFESVQNKLTEIKTYILSLKTSNGELLIKGRRKTGFLGFLICIESVFESYNELCIKNQLLKYIPFYKVSQDHIELLFGCIRAQGGGNNNPTARQFKSAMKKILIHADLRATHTGNCVPLEHISILHVSSAGNITNSERVINSTARLSRFDDSGPDDDNQDDSFLTDDLANVIDDHDYISDSRVISEFSRNVVEYIAGYVVMQLQNNLQCENCIAALAKNNINPNNLIAIKSRGGLVQPTKDVTIICEKCELTIRQYTRISGDMFMKKKFNETYLSMEVLKSFINVNLFENLTEHANDQSALENHQVHLVRAIIKKYIKIRLHYIALRTIDKSKNHRQFLNKIVLFKGQ